MQFSDPKKNITQFGLQVGQDVADLGAGSGHYVLESARVVGESGTVYAIDIQPEIVGRIAEDARASRITNIETLVGDLEKEQGSGLREGVVDAVIISNTLFQIQHKKELIKEARRILRDRGRLLVVDWKDSFRGIGPRPEEVVKESEVRAHAEEAGFTFEKTIDAGSYHYGLVFRV